MKNAILAAIFLLPVAVFAQDSKFTIQGSIAGANTPAKAYIQYRFRGQQVTDSTTVKNGKFKFKGWIGSLPISADLLFDPKGKSIDNAEDHRPVYLEEADLVITTDDKLANAKVEGSKTTTANDQYELAIKPANEAYAVLEEKHAAATPEQLNNPEFTAQETITRNAADVLREKINREFIQGHPDSFISLKALQVYSYNADYAEIAPLFNGLSPAIKNSGAGKGFSQLLYVYKTVALGATAPEFAEADTAGKIVKLSSFKGKYVLVDFWASWCMPCRQENPNVVRLYNRFKNGNFTVVGVSLDRPNSKKAWMDAIHHDGLYWTQLSDLKYGDSKTAILYGVFQIPQNFLLDPDGKIIAKNLHGDELRKKLEELLGKI